MARDYAGTVMLEGTTLSEGRGTTRPLELFGAPDVEARAVIGEMERIAPAWLDGCRLRDIWFQPTDRKSVVSGKSVSGRVDLGGGRIIKKKQNSNHHISSI